MNKHFRTAVFVEFIKIRKSKILFATILVFVFIPLMMGLMLFVAKNPDLAGKLGMIGTKAKLFNENDWPGYSALILQLAASVGMIGFGFITSWVFGREYIDRTLKDILALPVKRSMIVHSKMMISFLCCIILSLVLYIIAVLMGLSMNIPGGSASFFTQFTKNYLMTSALTLLLCSPVAYISCYSKGIVAPLGFVILTMILAQFSGLIGLGPYFPWAIPGLFSVSADADGLRLNAVSYILIFLTFLAGYYATIYKWKYSDH